MRDDPNAEPEPFEKLRHSHHRGNPVFENRGALKAAKKGERRHAKRRRGRAR